jgi:hypothetical protein
MIEPRVYAHERKCFGKIRRRDWGEPIPFIEAMRRHELVYRAQKQFPDPCAGRGQNQFVE